MNVNERVGKIDPNKAYAIRISDTEVEIYREFNTMKEAERMWKNPRFGSRRDFATTTGAFLLKLLEKRRLVEATNTNLREC